MHGDGDSFVLPVDPADDLGQMCLDLSERHRRHGHKYD